MTPQLEISREGPLGVIVLNRPEAINALNREMIDGIAETLEAWCDDAGVRLVLFEGKGPRGFCSGGDVRAVRSLVLAGRLDEAVGYFAAEYAMNLRIATYGKPIAAIGHGAVMGGGIGILGHARYRFALTGAKFAMPEAAIGFVPDIGVNAILAQAPEPRALAFLLSGMTVGVADALVLGLCDAAIDPARLEILRDGIVAAAGEPDVETALVQVMQAEGVDAGAADFSALADRLGPEFSGATAAEIITALGTQGAEAKGLVAVLASRSPTSLEVILASHRAARRHPDIAAVLKLDLALAGYMAQQPDFAEGVRALLVDKDQKPVWSPAAAAKVDREAVAAVIAATMDG